MQTQRRSVLKKIFAAVTGTVGLGFLANAEKNSPATKEVFNTETDQDVPLFSGATKFNGMVFIAGKGAHFAGDIKAHTDHVLKELEKDQPLLPLHRLEEGGSTRPACTSFEPLLPLPPLGEGRDGGFPAPVPTSSNRAAP